MNDFSLTDDQYHNMETAIVSVYREVTTSNYLTDRHQFEIAQSASVAIDRLELTNQSIDATIMFINGVLSLAKKFSTYASFERRFSQFFNGLLELRKQDFIHIGRQLNKKQHQEISTQLLYHYIDNLHLPSSPWDNVIRLWLLTVQSNEQLMNYLHELNNAQEKWPSHFSLSLLTSLVALYVGDGSQSISLLRPYKQVLKPLDIYDHFLFLKHTNEWETIRLWFDYFKPFWKHEKLGKLEDIYTESLFHRKKEKEDISDVIWGKWLQQPSLQKYKLLKQQYGLGPNEERLPSLLRSLKQQLHNPTTERLLLQLLLVEEQIDEAVEYFLMFEKSPLQLNDEKKQLLAMIQTRQPKAAIPIYHQFIVRLVERKTRQHYEEAVVYMKQLQSIYKTIGEIDQFYEYIRQLKQLYKTYRALIQEMKTIDLSL
ncbi:hypothetical protein [Alkalihalobacillus sp. LMS39]|uniref:hypothetical protein n=1 Tax=Alkalihalobacillus sp. LMS39 TaxID=2924032 RepID=UPI001FB4C703|nr:hypothetical protein [Alkalihalobacillus sp. LMS39]UOE93218.1 hypothetical protein MM271_18735 [Alkalihalobacillus sp. LMS39]